MTVVEGHVNTYAESSYNHAATPCLNQYIDAVCNQPHGEDPKQPRAEGLFRKRSECTA